MQLIDSHPAKHISTSCARRRGIETRINEEYTSTMFSTMCLCARQSRRSTKREIINNEANICVAVICVWCSKQTSHEYTHSDRAAESNSNKLFPTLVIDTTRIWWPPVRGFSVRSVQNVWIANVLVGRNYRQSTIGFCSFPKSHATQ